MAGIEFSNGTFMTIKGSRVSSREKGSAVGYKYQSNPRDKQDPVDPAKPVASAAQILRGIALNLSTGPTELPANKRRKS